MKKYICIDIGGTAIKQSDPDEALRLIEKSEIPTKSQVDGGPGIVKKVLKLVENWRRCYDISGVAISTAGMVEPKEGRIIYSCELIPGYTGTELKKIVEAASGLPCAVENDVNCAGLAESVTGAGKGASSCLCLTVGTGVGGCLILNGEIYHGFSNSACEAGYLSVGGESLQEKAAASVLVRKIADLRGISEDQLDGKQIFSEAQKGAADCVQAIDEMVEALSLGIANMVYILNPEVVVLGGGIMTQREYLEKRLQAALSEKIIPAVYRNTRLAFAQNGNDAGMVGALLNLLKEEKSR